MSKESTTKKTPNFIDDTDLEARRLFGYDEEALLQKFEEAEQELEQMKTQNPELKETLGAETEAGLEALMSRIHGAKLKPVTEQEYENTKRKAERKVISLKPLLKVMFVAAAVMVILMGMGIGVSAGKDFEYRKVKVRDVKNKVRWDNDGFSQDEDELQGIYEQIQDTIGIDALMINYIPMGMEFESVRVDKGHAIIQFLYNGKTVHFKQTKYIADGVSDSLVSDRDNIVEKVYNYYLEKEIFIEENRMQGDFVEYSVGINMQDAYYYLSCAASIEEFREMVKSLSFD